MKLSIVIVNYNTKKLILECINSIKKTKESIGYEIIVIDNASKDNSAAVLSKLKDIVFIKNVKNVGFARASNQGIKVAKGENILLLNPDTLVYKNSLKKLVDFAQRKKDAGVVGCALVAPSGKIQPSVIHFPTVKRAIEEYWLGRKGKFSPYVPKGKKAIAVDCVFGTVFLIKRKVLNEIGLLDERYFMYFEDLDYCRRVKKNGFRVYYLPTAKVMHYMGESGKDLVRWDDQWRRAIGSSKIYHGIIKHYLIFFVLWVEQRIRRTRNSFFVSAC